MYVVMVNYSFVTGADVVSRIRYDAQAQLYRELGVDQVTSGNFTGNDLKVEVGK